MGRISSILFASLLVFGLSCFAGEIASEDLAEENLESQEVIDFWAGYNRLVRAPLRRIIIDRGNEDTELELDSRLEDGEITTKDEIVINPVGNEVQETEDSLTYAQRCYLDAKDVELCITSRHEQYVEEDMQQQIIQQVIQEEPALKLLERR